MLDLLLLRAIAKNPHWAKLSSETSYLHFDSVCQARAKAHQRSTAIFCVSRNESAVGLTPHAREVPRRHRANRPTTVNISNVTATEPEGQLLGRIQCGFTRPSPERTFEISSQLK